MKFQKGHVGYFKGGKMPPRRHCIICGNFTHGTAKQYCSLKCKGVGLSGDKNPAKRLDIRKKISINTKGKKKSNRTKRFVTLICLVCKKDFIVSFGDRGRVLCSKKCACKYIGTKNQEHERTLEQRERMKIIQKEVCNRPEVRKKRSIHRKLYLQMHPEKVLKGERHPHWIKDRSLLERPDEWNDELRERIRERDAHRCQQCFRHQDELYSKKGLKLKLDIHHVDYNKKNNDLTNLVSLCRVCHMQTNYGRKEWESYFKKKVIE